MIPELSFTKKALPDLPSFHFVEQLKAGWNLGNTFDANNAFYLKEAAAYHLESECRKRKHPPVIKPLHEGVRVGRYDTDAFITERSKIRGYDKIMEL